MSQGSAKLTPFSRGLLVERVAEGWPVARAAEMMGISRATVYKWIRRYREEGLPGLEDRISRPRRCPHALPPSAVRRILAARRRLGAGPHHLGPLLGIPGQPSTQCSAATACPASATWTARPGFPCATNAPDPGSSCTST